MIWINALHCTPLDEATVTGGITRDMPQQLIANCEKARRAGKDFPTIWREILRPNPLVIGLPGHEIASGEARIIVNLRNGQTIVSTVGGYALR